MEKAVKRRKSELRNLFLRELRNKTGYLFPAQNKRINQIVTSMIIASDSRNP